MGEEAAPQQTSYLERSRAKAKSFLKRKRTLGTPAIDPDTIIDILYENQRGVFFFGIPRYSSSGLLPSDPRPWLNAQLRTSPVDIRNAQVPDPSWEWAWKSWYVDMSRDVDEEGWEYSFQFKGGWAWHGSHPWFHSFVRRRRWLRMRRRRDAHRHTKEKAHEFTADYFTIHPKTLRPMSEDLSKMDNSEMARLLREKEDEALDVEKMEIPDIGSLILALRHAPVDREKLFAVRKFVEQSGDELYYLADRMEEIMSLFIYQSSRRQLLTNLLKRYDETQKRQKDLADHDHRDESKTQKEHEAASRHAENLMNAVKAADEQVKKLEYWSDIKSMAQDGETLEESEGGKWDPSKWQGLSSPTSADAEHPSDVFKSKQKASEGVMDLHPHPEHPSAGRSGGKGTELPRKKSSSVWFDTKESSEDTGAYSTAAESVSELSRKRSSGGREKGKGRTLDGTAEESEDADAAETSQAAAPDIPSPRNRTQNVQAVEQEPVAETETSGSEAALPSAAIGASDEVMDAISHKVEGAKDAARDAKDAIKDRLPITRQKHEADSNGEGS